MDPRRIVTSGAGCVIRGLILCLSSVSFDAYPWQVFNQRIPRRLRRGLVLVFVVKENSSGETTKLAKYLVALLRG